MAINFKKILMAVLPWLFKLATKVWENLSDKQKAAVTSAVRFAQIIKTNLDTAPADVVLLLAKTLNLPITTITASLTGVAISLGHPEWSAADTVKYYQDKAKAGLDEFGWNSLWDTLGRLLTPHMSTEKLDWESLALGVVKVAFDMVIKK